MMIYAFGLVLLAVYAFMISLQLGGGLFLGLFGRDLARRTTILSYLSPVTAVTNTFLIVYLLALAAAYPLAPLLYGTTLLVPIFVGAGFLGLQIFSLFYLSFVNSDHLIYRGIATISSIVAPVFLVAFFSISMRNDFVLAGTDVQYSLQAMLTNSLFICLAILSLLHIVYFTASFLSYAPKDAGIKAFFSLIRRLFAIITPVFAVSLVWFFQDVPFFDRLIHVVWWIGILYLLGFIIAFFRANAWLHISHFIALFWVYAAAQYPFIMYNQIRVTDTTSNVSLLYLTWGTVIGLILLLPSLVYLVRIVGEEYRSKNS